MKAINKYLIALILAFLLNIPTISYAGDSVNLDSRLAHAKRMIKTTYGDKVLFSAKNKFLLKFGRNHEVGTTEVTLMNLPIGEINETYVNTDLINKFSSSSAADATETMSVEGHTCSGSGTSLQFTFVVQNITLAGQTETALTTPLCRVSRAYNTSSTTLAGAIYFYEDDTVVAGVPQTAIKIHMTIDAGQQQTHKAAATISNTDYFIITNIYGDTLEKTASSADIELQWRAPGGVFLPLSSLSASNAHSGWRDFNPPIVIPKNYDFRLVATADGAGTDISGGMNGYFAKVQ